MPAALVVAVPLGLAAAVRPMMLAEQTVLVASPGGRRSGTLYALGTALVVLVVMTLVVGLGATVALPRAPQLDASMDLALGLGLLLLAAGLHRRAEGRRAHGGRRRRGGDRSGMSPGAALGFGVGSMATNVTTLALVLVAGKDIATSGSSWPVRVLAAAVVVVLATIPAWAPVAATALPGHRAQALLDAVNHLVQRHGRQAVTGLLVLVGVVLVARGALRAIGLAVG